MICAEFKPIGGLSPTANQPADLATCPVILVTGSDLSAINGIAPPTPTDFGAAWGMGFTLVVGSYVVAWGIGAVLRFFK